IGTIIRQSDPETCDLAAIVDRHGVRKKPAVSAGDQIVEIVHPAPFPQEGPRLIPRRRIRLADNLARGISRKGRAIAAAKRAKIVHPHAIVDESVTDTCCCCRMAEDVTRSIDREGYALVTSQRAEIVHSVSVIQECVECTTAV